MKSSSHPRSHSLSLTHFRSSFSISLLFFGIIYHFGFSLCICNLLASLLSFLSYALLPLFLLFFILKIQFSLPLTSSRNSLYLPRYLLHSDLFLPLSPSFSSFLSIDLSFVIRSFRLFRFSAQLLPLISLSISDPLLLSPIFFPAFSYFLTLPSRLSSHFHPFLPLNFILIIIFLLLSLHVPSSSRLPCYSLPYVFFPSVSLTRSLTPSHRPSLPHFSEPSDLQFRISSSLPASLNLPSLLNISLPLSLPPFSDFVLSFSDFLRSPQSSIFVFSVFISCLHFSFHLIQIPLSHFFRNLSPILL